jgi:hypothetical protein
VDTRGSIKLADFGAAKKIEGLFAATNNNRSGIGSLKGTVPTLFAFLFSFIEDIS